MTDTNYFKQFPKTIYKRPSNSIQVGTKTYPYELEVADIFVRSKVRDLVLSNTSLFYPYRWKDTDRPEIVAERYYGSEVYFWVVFFSNQSFDLDYDFPMGESQFRNFMFLKYKDAAIKEGTIVENGYTDETFAALPDADQQTLIDAYTTDIYGALDTSGKLVFVNSYVNTTIKFYEIEGLYQVDYETYAAAIDELKRAATIYDYEFELNESKRNVQLLDNAYLQQVLKEFADQMRKAQSEVV